MTQVQRTERGAGAPREWRDVARGVLRSVEPLKHQLRSCLQQDQLLLQSPQLKVWYVSNFDRKSTTES